MKKTFSFFLVQVCLLMISSQAVSEDLAWFRIIGFSEDGVYAAWEMGGIQDGSGFQWVEAEVLDTETSLEAARYRHVWDEGVDELPSAEDVAAVEQNILDLCEKYGIRSGSYESALVYHPLTDLGVNGDTVVFCLERYSPRYNSGEIILTLALMPADVEQGYPDWFDSPVTPVLHTVCDGERKLFFSEDTVQGQHVLSFDYSIAAVYKNPGIENSFLVVLHSVRPGFEGPDGRFRVVCGSI
ncbi:MAG: hypothetical protein KAS73_12880 [Candidatus Sabulitectum sp.]|nr:hypothetical protein [Candidatus Sabulitectum sp.]